MPPVNQPPRASVAPRCSFVSPPAGFAKFAIHRIEVLETRGTLGAGPGIDAGEALQQQQHQQPRCAQYHSMCADCCVLLQRQTSSLLAAVLSSVPPRFFHMYRCVCVEPQCQLRA